MNTTPLNDDRSNALKLKLKAQMRSEAMSFSQFMDECLVGEFGYYQGKKDLFGKQGDFTTASELEVFAKILSIKLIQWLKTFGLPLQIAEIGPGDGTLAFNLLENLHQKGLCIESYTLVEVSKTLTQKQQAKLQAFKATKTKLQWAESLPQGFEGLIIANEVVDALGVDCFCLEVEAKPTSKGVAFCYEGFEKKVIYDEVSKNFQFKRFKAGPNLSQYLKSQQHYWQDHLQNLNPPIKNKQHFSIQGEYRLNDLNWFEQLHKRTQRAVLWVLDYGLGARDLWHPSRFEGTLRLFSNHKLTTDPFANIGQSDMTCHLNLDYVVQCAQKAGWHLFHQQNQRDFLTHQLHWLEKDLLELPTTLRLALISQLQKLVMPYEMGDIFWAMSFSTHKTNDEVFNHLLLE